MEKEGQALGEGRSRGRRQSKNQANNGVIEHPTKLHMWSAAMMLMVGALLLVMGFYAPPQGEIHYSILIAFGEILTFAGGLMGMNYVYKWQLYKFTSAINSRLNK